MCDPEINASTGDSTVSVYVYMRLLAGAYLSSLQILQSVASEIIEAPPPTRVGYGGCEYWKIDQFNAPHSTRRGEGIGIETYTT